MKLSSVDLLLNQSISATFSVKAIIEFVFIPRNLMIHTNTLIVYSNQFDLYHFGDNVEGVNGIGH